MRQEILHKERTLVRQVQWVVSNLAKNGLADNIVDAELHVELASVVYTCGELMKSTGGDLDRHLELSRVQVVQFVLIFLP